MYQVNFLPWRQRRERRRGYFWLGVLLLQVTVLLLALLLVAGQLRHQQTQRQARLAMLGEELTALTSLARRQQQERAQQAMHSARAERQARNVQHNRRYLQLLQRLSSTVPPPLWLTALESDMANGLRLRGLSRTPAAITQFERRLAEMPTLPRLRLAEVVQRDDGLYTFHLVAQLQWGRDG
ncbi:TPA: PilN domain-containing protein [Serratia marcescens]|nr:PilN domain-containing protein [Serratia marcescens]HAT5030788.1 PilN domain-containing protein [Serratia marcescens]